MYRLENRHYALVGLFYNRRHIRLKLIVFARASRYLILGLIST